MSAALIEQWAPLWRPPEKLSLSEWAEKHFVLSPEYSRTTGELKLHGWQREILDSFTDPTVTNIVLKTGTQLIKSLFIQAAIAYVIAEAPGPILVGLPKDDDAIGFSKERLSPMLRDIPKLRGKVGEATERKGDGTIQYKPFPGGVLSIVGAGSPSNAARRSIRYCFLDEVNKYEASKEGNFIKLAQERLATFESSRKLIETCSPTTAKAEISKAYEASDKREPWVPCYACGEMQVMRWSAVRFGDSQEELEQAEGAYYECIHCKAHWNDLQRWNAAEETQWIAQKRFDGTAGFGSLGHLYSPWKTLRDMVREFLKAKVDPRDLQVFVNTTLAEDWEERGEAPEWKRLYDRREQYKIGRIPRGGLFITLSCDVQGDRLEVEVVAWGRNGENWSIWYEVIQPFRPNPITGAMEPIRPSEIQPWERLAELIDADWEHIDGKRLKIAAACIDTGHMAETVYAFCRRYPQPAHGGAGSTVVSPQTVIPTKGGHDAFRIIEGVSNIDRAKVRGGLRIVTIGTHRAKQQIYNDLKKETPIGDVPFPAGFCHFPEYDTEYFKGLTAETKIISDKGVVSWRKDGRNEPLDLRVMNLAAMTMCGANDLSEDSWQQLERNVATPPKTTVLSGETPPADYAAIREAEITEAGPSRDPWMKREPVKSDKPGWVPKRNWF